MISAWLTWHIKFDVVLMWSCCKRRHRPIWLQPRTRLSDKMTNSQVSGCLLQTAQTWANAGVCSASCAHAFGCMYVTLVVCVDLFPLTAFSCRSRCSSQSIFVFSGDCDKNKSRSTDIIPMTRYLAPMSLQDWGHNTEVIAVVWELMCNQQGPSPKP